MKKPARACLVCGARNCSKHVPSKRGGRESQRRDEKRRPRNYAEAQRHREMVRAHVALYGLVCPGAPGHPAHRIASARELTVDHIVPVKISGDPNVGPERVLCRQWNSTTGARLASPASSPR